MVKMNGPFFPHYHLCDGMDLTVFLNVPFFLADAAQGGDIDPGRGPARECLGQDRRQCRLGEHLRARLADDHAGGGQGSRRVHQGEENFLARTGNKFWGSPWFSSPGFLRMSVILPPSGVLPLLETEFS
jgi:hypothetical protein